MKKSDRRWLILIGLVFLVGLALIGLFFGWFSPRGRAFNSRPLVLIHSPINNEPVQVGEGITVHATARENQGLARMELWVDGILVAEQEAPQSYPTNLTLFSTWIPKYAGEHLVVVQAFSRDGVQGQASIRILASMSGEGTENAPLDEEIGSAESIPGEDEVSTEGDPDRPDRAGRTSPEEEPSLPPDDRTAPFPAGDAPLMGSIIDTLGLFTGPAEETILQLELVLLRTYESYSRLHCYVSLAGNLPRWYPDADHNQATDEYFLSKGHGWWETEPALEGDSAPIISWPGDESLPMTLSCIGITGSGTEAVELGRTEIQIPPEEWNGIQHNYMVEGDGGGYFFSTRVTEVDTIPRLRSKYLDPDMPVPTNVRINDPESKLEWDFVPDPEEPIDGFRIYLNDTLQWTEPADVRESSLPNEWINPPCATTYTFSVSSYRIEYPDGPESEKGTFALSEPREGCTREIQVTFLTLETFNLGGDGNYEDRRGDVGPAYGTFYANENQIDFNGRGEGLSHNTTYDIGAMAIDPDWRFSRGRNSTIVEISPGGSLIFRYTIFDRDDRNPNDTICEGTSGIFDESREGIFNRVNEELIISDNHRCDVVVRWGPAFDSPVGGITEGEEPLPWLSVEDLFIDEATGEVSLEIRNTGTATWASRDLEVEIQDRLGRSLGNFTWPDYEIGPGEYDTLQQEHMVVNPPYDACVLIDPNNAVLEEGEILGTTAHGPYCPQLPDLTITNAYYSPVGEMGRIIAMVQNSGRVELINRTLEFEVGMGGGASLEYTVPRVSLAPGEIRPFHIRGVTESMREAMVRGYSVTLNPDRSVVETNYLNNRFDISDGEQIALKWVYIEVPYRYHGLYSFHFDAYIVTGRNQEQIVNWDVNENVRWGSCGEGSNCSRAFEGDDFSTSRFMIYGDQELRVVITMIPRGDPLYGAPLSGTKSSSWNFGSPTWGGGEFHPESTLCDYYPMRDGGIHRRILDFTGSQSWNTRFDICWEGYGR